MIIEDLKDGKKEKNPIKFPVTIPLKKEDEKRFSQLRIYIRKNHPDLSMLNYARIAIIKMMDEVEEKLREARNEKAG